MKTFHGKQELKDMLIEEIKWHRSQDMITQGTYREEVDGKWRGCAVGCAIHSLNRKLGKNYDFADYTVYETELGIPRAVVELEDRIFKELAKNLFLDFPLRFMEAVPVGVDLWYVFPSMMIFILNDCKQHATPQTQNVMDDVIHLFQRQLAGEEVSLKEWEKMSDAATVNADAAANAYNPNTYGISAAIYNAAANASAAFAAADAIRKDEDAIYNAANAAALATDAVAARQNAFRRYADELIRLLENPITKPKQ